MAEELESKNKPPIILFVDPDVADFKYLNEITADQALELVWKQDAKSALEYLENNPADIMISDWEIRDESGHRLTSLLKANPEWSGIYTFLIAERQRIHDVVRAMLKGADDVMVKPIDKEVFLARIEVALRMRKVLHLQTALHHHEGIMETVTAVAHEINNPLFAVLGNIDILLDELEEMMEQPDNVLIKDCLTTINEQGERMAEVVRKLQAITKPRTRKYVGEANMLDLHTPTNEILRDITPDQKTKKNVTDP